MTDPYERSVEGLRKMLTNMNLTEGQCKYVINKIRNSLRGTDCVDNFRLAINNIGIEEYERKQRSGCCGSCDEQLILHDGTIVNYGFNYGH